MVFFVVPEHDVEAQSGTTQTFCFNAVSGADAVASSNLQNPCPTGFAKITLSKKAGGYCVISYNNASYEALEAYVDSISKDGKSCLDPSSADKDEKERTVIGTFRKFPAGTTVTPPPNPGGGGTKPPTPAPGGGTGGNNTTYVQGGCEDNFHEVGPLCVPDSNFSSNSIVGTNTAPGIATRIIRLFLYFAGIVAIIMAIVGGYQVMTAAGNPTQAANGRKTLTNAIIGLVIVLLAYLIVQVVINFVSK